MAKNIEQKVQKLLHKEQPIWRKLLRPVHIGIAAVVIALGGVAYYYSSHSKQDNTIYIGGNSDMRIGTLTTSIPKYYGEIANRKYGLIQQYFFNNPTKLKEIVDDTQVLNILTNFRKKYTNGTYQADYNYTLRRKAKTANARIYNGCLFLTIDYDENNDGKPDKLICLLRTTKATESFTDQSGRTDRQVKPLYYTIPINPHTSGTHGAVILP